MGLPQYSKCGWTRDLHKGITILEYLFSLSWCSLLRSFWLIHFYSRCVLSWCFHWAISHHPKSLSRIVSDPITVYVMLRFIALMDINLHSCMLNFQHFQVSCPFTRFGKIFWRSLTTSRFLPPSNLVYLQTRPFYCSRLTPVHQKVKLTKLCKCCFVLLNSILWWNCSDGREGCRTLSITWFWSQTHWPSPCRILF